MDRNAASGIMLTLLLTSMLTLAFNIQPVKAEPTTIIVPDDYPTIQAAIDAASDGDTIRVAAGTYYEQLDIRKSLTLIGENKSTTIINGNGTISIILAFGPRVNIRGFTIQNGTYGLYLTWLHNSTISDNIISSVNCAIRLEVSDNNTISGNTITSKWKERRGKGIWLIRCPGDNIISVNTLTENHEGVYLVSSNGTGISGNTILDNNQGIRLHEDGYGHGGSSNNTIIGNTIKNSGEYGISLLNSSSGNLIYHNNFINNTGQVHHYQTPLPSNRWDNGAEGNYWSDYIGVDDGSGGRVAGDGIGDTLIPHQGVDYYPLINLWVDTTPPVADAGTDQTVAEDTVVSFDAVGSTDNMGIVSFEWDFGDGTSGTGLTTTHTYTELGNHTVTLTVKDAAGNNDTDSITVTVLRDTTPPTISIVSPENKTYPVEDVPLTFTVSESTSWIGYRLDGEANVTITGNTTLSGLSDGSHSLIVYAKDTVGNTGASEIIYFTIETEKEEETFPTWIIAPIVIIAVVGAALLVYFTKIKKTTEKVK